MDKNPTPDWKKIEADYRAGIKTLRQIAGDHGITEGAIRKRAKRDGWERAERAIDRDTPVKLDDADDGGGDEAAHGAPRSEAEGSRG